MEIRQVRKRSSGFLKKVHNYCYLRGKGVALCKPAIQHKLLWLTPVKLKLGKHKKGKQFNCIGTSFLGDRVVL